MICITFVCAQKRGPACLTLCVLPVVIRADVTKLEGAIFKEDVLKRYENVGKELKEHR